MSPYSHLAVEVVIDISPLVQNSILRFTSGVTHADLLEASMAAKPFSFVHL